MSKIRTQRHRDIGYSKKKEDNDKYRNIIYEILNENNDDWEIIDKYDNLVMIHYNNNSDLNYTGYIRGIIIDIKNKCIVCKTYPADIPIESNYLTEIEQKVRGNKIKEKYYIASVSDNQKLQNERFDTYMFIKKYCTFYHGFDGVMIRAFFWDGKIYFSSYRKINSFESNSFLKQLKYKDAYFNANGPSEDILFKTKKKYSPWIHNFIIVNNKYTDNSQQYISDSGFLVYLGAIKMNINFKDFAHKEDIDNSVWVPSEDMFVSNLKELYEDQISSNESKKIYVEKNLSSEEVNHFLRYGHYKKSDNYDRFLNLGEFIIAYVECEHGTPMVYRLESSAYTWRHTISPRFTSSKHLIMSCSIHVHNVYINKQNLSLYNKIYPNLSEYTIEDIKKYKILNYNKFKTEDDIDDITISMSSSKIFNQKDISYNKLLENTWKCLLLSIPYKYFDKMLDILDEREKIYSDIIEFFRLEEDEYNRYDKYLNLKAKEFYINNKYKINKILISENYSDEEAKTYFLNVNPVSILKFHNQMSSAKKII